MRRRPSGRVERRRAGVHLHWFRWTGFDDFSAASLYTCRCGAVHPGV